MGIHKDRIAKEIAAISLNASNSPDEAIQVFVAALSANPITATQISVTFLK